MQLKEKTCPCAPVPLCPRKTMPRGPGAQVPRCPGAQAHRRGFIIAVIILLTLLAYKPLALAQWVDTGNVSSISPQNYFGIPDTSPYDISFRQASLREALQFLAWIADFNVVIPEGTEGTVNASFHDITIGDALNAIIKSNSLDYTVEGRVVRIGKSEQFKESGEDLKSETFRLKYAPARELEPKVKTLLSTRGSVVHDERTNSLVVRELPGNIDNVRRFVEDVDIKDAQVLIESKILEATRTFGRDLGIQWGVTKAGGSTEFRTAGIKAAGQGDAGRNLNVNLSAPAPTSGLMIGSIIRGVNLDIQISMAEKRGDAYIISDPSIVTSNGKSANIRSGATLLVQGSSTVNIGTTSSTGSTSGGTSMGSGLQEIETGVELTVTPQITLNDFIKLDIKTVTSTPDFSRAIQGIPIVVDNKASTTVLVRDGETTVIGGLTRFSDSLQKGSVPLLSRLPLVGVLFKSKARKSENTELMVFIKPTIVRMDGILPAQLRVRELEERREAMRLEPILDPKKDQEKAERKERLIRSRRGNKYVR